MNFEVVDELPKECPRCNKVLPRITSSADALPGPVWMVVSIVPQTKELICQAPCDCPENYRCVVRSKKR